MSIPSPTAPVAAPSRSSFTHGLRYGFTGLVIGALTACTSIVVYSVRVHADDVYVDGVIERSQDRFEDMFDRLATRTERTVHAEWKVLMTRQRQAIWRTNAQIETAAKKRLEELEATLETRNQAYQAAFDKRLVAELAQRDSAIQALINTKMDELRTSIEDTLTSGNAEFLDSAKQKQAELQNTLRAGLRKDNDALGAKLVSGWQDERRQLTARMSAFGNELSAQQGRFLEQAKQQQRAHHDAVQVIVDANAKMVSDLHAHHIAQQRRDAATHAAATKSVADAKMLLNQGNIAHAGWYFSNALSHDPTNFALIADYTTHVLTWNDQSAVSSAVRLHMLDDLEALISSHIVALNSTDLPRVKPLLERLRQSATATRQQVKAAQVAELATRNASHREQIAQILSQPIPDTRDAAVAEAETLERWTAPLRASTNSADVTVVTTVDRRRHDLGKVIRTDTALDDIADALSYVETNNLWTAGRQNYIIRRTQSALDELRLGAHHLPSPLQQRIQTMASQFTDQLNSALSNREETIVQTLQSRYEALTTADDNKPKQESLEFAETVLRHISTAALELTTPTSAEQARELAAAVQRHQRKLSQEQLADYNTWALQRIKTMYDDNVDQLGAFKNTDEGKLEDDLINHLGNVDRGLLTPSLNRCYDEVFNLFYNHLTSDQKITFSYRMAATTHTPLSTF